MEEIKKQNTQVEETENKEKEAEVMVELSITLTNDGKINLQVKNEDAHIDVVEDMLKKTYENVYEQRIIQKALETFKSRL